MAATHLYNMSSAKFRKIYDSWTTDNYWFTDNTATTAITPYSSWTTSTNDTCTWHQGQITDCTITNTFTDNWWGCWTSGASELSSYYTSLKRDPNQQMRDILSSRRSPAVFVRGKAPSQECDHREIRARQTLRSVVGETEFRRFLKFGFVCVRNRKSFRMYQIYGGHSHFTNVYENGKMINRLCVYLAGDFPPTDQLIIRCLMAINDEDRFWNLANKHAPTRVTRPSLPVHDQPLPEVYKQLKLTA